MLIFLTEQAKYSAVQAWRICRPTHGASDHGAQTLVARWKRWHREKYPPGILEVFAEEGVTMKFMSAFSGRARKR